MSHTITPYVRGHYPTIEGNDRIYFEDEFRKIEDCLRQIIDSLVEESTAATIATAVISVPNTRNPVVVMIVDTESAAATDDLETISGGYAGQVTVLRAANSSRTVVCKDGVDNLVLAGDFSLDNVEDTITLVSDGTNWYELSRSDNGA